MLYLFDLDGTLVTSYMDRPDRNYNAWSVLPGRRERIAALVAEDHQIGIVTNQGGVGYGYVTREDAREKLLRVADELGYAHIELFEDEGDSLALQTRWLTSHPGAITPRALPIFVCYDVIGGRRKPNGTMLHEAERRIALDYYDEEACRFEPVPILFVGDRPEDKQAAANAGVSFAWADAFFAS